MPKFLWIIPAKNSNTSQFDARIKILRDDPSKKNKLAYLDVNKN